MTAVAGPSSFKEMEREGWHTQAPHYDDRAGRMTSQAIGRLLDAAGARPGMRLLDICCGPGYGAGEAVARGLSAIGIDIAPAMVEEARRRFPAAAFQAGDAEALDFPDAGPDAGFDAAICAFGLLHLPEPAKAIAEAFRVLRPGGRYAFTVWSTPDKAVLLGLGFQAMMAHADMNIPLPPAPPIFQLSGPDFTLPLLEAAGFQGGIFEEVPITYHGQRPEDVWDWFEKSTVRTIAVHDLQTPEVQARIRKAVMDGAGRYLREDGLSIPCTAVLYAAHKPGSG